MHRIPETIGAQSENKRRGRKARSRGARGVGRAGRRCFLLADLGRGELYLPTLPLGVSFGTYLLCLEMVQGRGREGMWVVEDAGVAYRDGAEEDSC